MVALVPPRVSSGLRVRPLAWAPGDREISSRLSPSSALAPPSTALDTMRVQRSPARKSRRVFDFDLATLQQFSVMRQDEVRHVYRT